MKSFESKDSASGIVYSTAMYTAAWSAGQATGPFIFGILDWKTGFYTNVVFSLCLALGVLLVEKLRATATPAIEQKPRESDVDYGKYPDYAWLGWLGAGVGTTTISIVRTLEPKLAVDLGLAKIHAGSILALVSVMVIWDSPDEQQRWMLHQQHFWEASPVTGLLLFASGKRCRCFGGSHIVRKLQRIFLFHAGILRVSSSRERAHYLAINEAVVGIAGIPVQLAAALAVTICESPFRLQQC